MKIVLAIIVLTLFMTPNKYQDYKNCMLGTKLDYISERGAQHIAAQCKAFILEQLMSAD